MKNLEKIMKLAESEDLYCEIGLFLEEAAICKSDLGIESYEDTDLIYYTPFGLFAERKAEKQSGKESLEFVAPRCDEDGELIFQIIGGQK